MQTIWKSGDFLLAATKAGAIRRTSGGTSLYATGNGAAYMHNYKNKGLYSESDIPVVERIRTFGRNAGYYDLVSTPRGSFYNTFQPKWWHIIYKIPRLY